MDRLTYFYDNQLIYLCDTTNTSIWTPDDIHVHGTTVINEDSACKMIIAAPPVPHVSRCHSQLAYSTDRQTSVTCSMMECLLKWDPASCEWWNVMIFIAALVSEVDFSSDGR